MGNRSSKSSKKKTKHEEATNIKFNNIENDYNRLCTYKGEYSIDLLTVIKENNTHDEFNQDLNTIIGILNNLIKTGEMTSENFEKINNILVNILYINYIINREKYTDKHKAQLDNLKSFLLDYVEENEDIENMDNKILEKYSVNDYSELISKLMIPLSIIFLYLYSNIKNWEDYVCQLIFLDCNIGINEKNIEYKHIDKQFRDFLNIVKKTIDSEINKLRIEDTDAQYHQYCYES